MLRIESLLQPVEQLHHGGWLLQPAAMHTYVSAAAYRTLHVCARWGCATLKLMLGCCSRSSKCGWLLHPVAQMCRKFDHGCGLAVSAGREMMQVEFHRSCSELHPVV